MKPPLRGEVALGKLTFRATRIRTSVYAYVYAALAFALVFGYRSSFTTPAERVQVVVLQGGNAALRLFYGFPRRLDTPGGYAAWRMGGSLVILSGLWGAFAGARGLRGQEEPGRWELILGGTVRRVGANVAVFAAVLAGAAILWTGAALGLLAAGWHHSDVPVGAALYLALAALAPAPLFAAVGMLASQLSHRERGAKEIAGGAVGVAFLIRVVADTHDGFGWLRWATPLGWAEELRAFADPRPWVLLLFAGATAIVAWTAIAIAVRRDVGDAVLAPRDTARARTGLLRSPTTMAVRLELPGVAGWTIGLGAFALVIGALAKTAAEIIRADPSLVERLGSLATKLATPAGYVGLVFSIFAVAISLFVTSQLSAVREEEAGGRLETLFSQPTDRVRWLSGRLLTIAVGAGVIAIATGLFCWVGTAFDRAGVSVSAMVQAGANCLPVAVLFLGLGALVFGVAPRAAQAATYGMVGGSYLWQLFGALLKAPGWALDLSAFHHVPNVPADVFRPVPALLMAAIGLAAAAAGAGAFRRRDLTTG